MAQNAPPASQTQLIAPTDLAGAVALQDGLHNLIQTPAFQQVMNQAIWSFFGPMFEGEPGLLEAVRRFINKGRRNDARSISVRTAANGGPTKLVERDEERIELIVYNNGAAPVYIGGRQVTVGGLNDANGGVPIQPATGMVLDNNVGELWAATGTDAMDVRVLDIAGGINTPGGATVQL